MDHLATEIIARSSRSFPDAPTVMALAVPGEATRLDKLFESFRPE
jgi:hypothetical protein